MLPGLESKMPLSEAEAEQSSSSISSPPVSPQNSDTIHVARASLFSGEGVAHKKPAAEAVKAAAANGHIPTPATTTTSNGNSAPEKVKRPRKKKEVPLGPDGKPVVEEKVKKPRKPREPKDKAAAASATTASRKRVKAEPKTEDKAAHDATSQATRQPRITEMVGAFSHPSQPASTAMPPQPHRNPDGLIHRNSLPVPPSNPSTPRPVSSGQNYDPIRGSTMDTRPSAPPPATIPQQQHQVSPHVNRASASPSIASLIDPPSSFKAPAQASHCPPQTSMQPSIQLGNVPSKQSPPPPQTNTAPVPPPVQPSPPPVKAPSTVVTHDGAMDFEPTFNTPSRTIPEVKAPSKSASPAPTPPKAPRISPPKGTGSGLLSSSDLFGGPSTADHSERRGVNIDLHIPLNPAGGNNINIAQEIIRKYGRDAINPRAAAHREQLLRIAAEQERLGGASNDEMSVDLMSEMEGDSNVEMGGMDDEKSNTGADAKPRQRKRKVEDYDKEDDFIDDTELAWQEGAAVAKDGFFVYSGPLVPEGQAAQVESTAPTRGGRGRGGRGSRGGRAAAAAAGGTTHASLAEKSRDTSSAAATVTTATRGTRGTRGGRGSGAPRKPRITKAEKEKMESEKLDRARAAANITAPPSALGTSSALPAQLQQQPPVQHSLLAPPSTQQQQHQQAQPIPVSALSMQNRPQVGHPVSAVGGRV